MMQGRKRYRRLICLVWAAALLLAACSSPSLVNPAPSGEAALFNDSDMDGALLELADSLEEVSGLEAGEVPDGNESDLLEGEEELVTQAVLSGSSGHLAYVRHDPDASEPWQLWLADQTSDVKQKVYEGNRRIQSVAVSLDGNTLIFAMNQTASSSNVEVYRLILSPRSVTRLTNTSTAESDVSMSADGNTLVWEGSSGDRRAVFIREYNDSGFQQSVLKSSRDQVQPSVSDDGSYIALIRLISSGYRVMRYHKASKSYLSVTSSSDKLEHASVSNGGAKVAWLVRRSAGDRVRVKTIASGSITRVVSDTAIEHPHLTADGGFLAYGLKRNGSWNVYTKNLTSGQVAHGASSSAPVNHYAMYWQKAAATSTSLATVEVARGLTRPTAIAHAGDSSGRLFITLRGGQIVVFDGSRILETPFLDVSQLVAYGLLDIAFHPNYKNNRYFYINYVDPNRNTVIARYTTQLDNPNVADPNSAKIILTINEATSDHWGGQTKFGPDGYLYISVGDGGPQGDPNNNAQNRDNLLGAMLRIDVDGGDPYTVPTSNPFVNIAGAKGEIWAYGLRNPWRFSFDRATGDLFIGDVGYQTKEEINFQPASSRGGENYGWRQMEGSSCFNPSSNCNDGTLVLPILEYDTGENCSVTGGYRYRGNRMSELEGTYIYGDYCSGRIWGATLSNGRWTNQELLKTPYNIVSFGEDEAGEMYLADFSQGGIYRLETR